MNLIITLVSWSLPYFHSSSWVFTLINLKVNESLMFFHWYILPIIYIFLIVFYLLSCSASLLHYLLVVLLFFLSKIFLFQLCCYSSMVAFASLNSANCLVLTFRGMLNSSTKLGTQVVFILLGLNKDFRKMLGDAAELKALSVKDVLTASDGTRKVTLSISRFLLLLLRIGL